MTAFLRRVAPLSGVVFGLLILVAFIIGGSSPGAGSTGTHVIDWYTKHHNSQNAVAFLLAYAAFFGLVWAASLKAYLSARSDSKAALTLGFGGFVTLAVGLAVFSGLGFALVDDTKKYETGAAQALNVLDNDMFVSLLVGLAAFMLANGLVIAMSGALPKWLGWIALVIGIVEMTPLGWFGLLALIAWSIVVSVWVFIREGKQPSAGAVGSPPEPAPAA